LKKIILMAVIGFAGWSYYQNGMPGRSSVDQQTPSQPLAPDQVAQSRASQVVPKFRCDGRQHCSQMTSREEAVFFTRNCPNTKMDGDRDGIPCENDSRF